MTDIQIFNNPEFGSIRTVDQNGEPWFVGKDVAQALGYSNPRDALSKHVDEQDKNSVAFRDGTSGNPNITIINESGLYSLIFGSKLEGAVRFKRWVTSEVLPTLRKTGSYSVVSTSNQLQDLSPELQYLIKLERQQNQQARKIEQLAESFEATRNAFSLSSGPDWKKACQNVISSIAMKRGGTDDDFESVWNEIYESMERRGFNLELRVSNAKSRAMKNGICKSDVRKISKAKIIEAGGKKIICAFVDSVRELAAKTGTRVDKLDEINQTSLFDCNCAPAGSLVDAQEPAVMGKGEYDEAYDA